MLPLCLRPRRIAQNLGAHAHSLGRLPSAFQRALARSHGVPRRLSVRFFTFRWTPVSSLVPMAPGLLGVRLPTPSDRIQTRGKFDMVNARTRVAAVLALFLIAGAASAIVGVARADETPQLPAYFTATNADAAK